MARHCPECARRVYYGIYCSGSDCADIAYERWRGGRQRLLTRGDVCPECTKGIVDPVYSGSRNLQCAYCWTIFAWPEWRKTVRR